MYIFYMNLFWMQLLYYQCSLDDPDSNLSPGSPNSQNRLYYYLLQKLIINLCNQTSI